MWYNLKVAKYNLKYTPLNPIEKEYPSCDAKGNILKKVAGKFEKGHYINEATGEQHDTAFKLVNGKASTGFKGRISEMTNIKEIPINEASDIIVEKEFLAENQELYDDLVEKNKAIASTGYFGTGFKAYKVYFTPSPLYKGFIDMKAGTTQRSELISELVGGLTDMKKLSEKLAEVELTIQKVTQIKMEDMIQL